MKEIQEDSIAYRINHLRTEVKHYTLDALAELTGINRSTLWRYENGQIPDPYNMKILAKALGCEVSYLDGTIDYFERETADIAEITPLSEASIVLLRGLKRECDNRSDETILADESLLTAFITDFVIASTIADHHIGGINEILLSLMRDYLDALEIMDEFEDSKKIERSERYMKSKWALEDAEKRTGQLFGEIICEQLKIYSHSGVKLTDNIILGYRRKEGDEDGNI